MLIKLQSLLNHLVPANLRTVRSIVILCVAVVALLSTTIAIGQTAQDFDLACRSHFTAGSGVITGGDFAVNGVLGSSIVPPQESSTAPIYVVRSQDFAMRAGFLPVYEGRQETPGEVVVPESDFTQRLPLLFRAAHIVRGGC